MQKIKNEFLMIAFIIVVILFFYFSAGVMIDRGLYVRMHGNGWAGSMSWRMYPATITLVLSAVLAWLLFRKRNSKIFREKKCSD
ncbi:MAG: hypothetical protein WCA84_04440 [Ignavibacteriaceae bacterium]|jgi:hypothetical protein